MRAARLAPWVLVWLMALMTPAQAQIVPFSQLTGWNDDDHLAALKTFQNSCKRLSGPEWGSVCALSQTAPQTLASAKAFF